ncbi:MAG: ribosome-associated protein [Actinomycetota bacterium]|nr:ribosome-associated protein [Actinomycetota bacterium]
MATAQQPAEGVVIPGAFTIPAVELGWKFSRSSGPGGQGVNTTDSRVQLTWDLAHSPTIPAHLRQRALARLGARLVDGTIVITASEHRSQWQNRRAAEQRLANLLGAALAPPPRTRRPTKPSRGAKQRRLEAKARRGSTKRLRKVTRDDLG